MALSWTCLAVVFLHVISLGITDKTKDVSSSMKRKIIIDSTGGANDAFALIWAIHALNDDLLDIEALTTVETELNSYDAFKNVVHVLNITKHNNMKQKKKVLSIPVAKARTNDDIGIDADAYSDEASETEALIANDGFFGFSETFYKYPDIFSTKKKIKTAFESASFSDDLLIETILKYPHQISVITTGPLTNLYLAETKHAGILSLIKDIYILGGEFANRTGDSPHHPLSEYNFNYDSNALYQVFNMMDKSSTAPPNVFIFPLDTSHTLRYDLQQLSLLYMLLETDTQTEIEMCRMKMEKDEDGLGFDADDDEDMFDDRDLYDSDRTNSEDESIYDDLFCTQSALLYIFYEKMMDESVRKNYLNGYCSCLQLADSSLIGYLLYPHLYDFKYVNCKINQENGMIWHDKRLSSATKESISIPNCFVNVEVDADKLIHAFNRDSVHMMHDAFRDYMENIMNEYEW